MDDTLPPSGERPPEAKALKARIALGVKILTNAGYAMVGGAAFKPLVETRVLDLAGGLWGLAGILALGFALVLAPDGSSVDD